MKRLLAKCPILYHSHTYQKGEELPTGNLDDVKIWLAHKVAEWEKEEGQEEGQEEQEEEQEEQKEEQEEQKEEQEEQEEKQEEVKEAHKNTQKNVSVSDTKKTTIKVPTGRNNKKK